MKVVLSRIKPLSQTRNGFTHIENNCNFIPFYQFRFVDNYDDAIYLKIKQCVESFEGNVKWSLMSDDVFGVRRLHTIIPLKYSVTNCAFGIREEARGKINNGQLFQDELYGIQVFNETLFLAKKDIPRLIEYLNKNIQNDYL